MMTGSESAAYPLVSCIMPTHNRRRFVPQALQWFLGQDYPNRELIVVDDGSDPVADLMPEDERIRYVRLARTCTIGEKRNRACSLARGQIIAHWDDDDWMAPNRLTHQVAALRSREVDVCGWDRLTFVDPDAGEAWAYRYRGARPWVAGGTLCYWKHFWAEHPFAAMNDGEDTRFVWRASPDRVLVLDVPELYVARIHRGSSSRKHVQSPRWQPRPLSTVMQVVGDDWPVFAGSKAATVPGTARSTVTVSIPCYCNRTTIRRAVDSILGQTYRNLRVVVVKDGDPDPPWDLLTDIDDPRLVRVDLEVNRGRYFADAVVLGATPDAYFMPQDADDWSEPDRVERLLDRLRLEGTDVAYSHSYKCLSDSPEDRWVERFAELSTPLGDAFIHRANYPAGLYRADALRRIGGVFGGLRIGYDSLLVNLLRMTARISVVDAPLTTYCMRPDSLTGAPGTGFGTPERDAAWDALNARYHDALSLWKRQQAGEFRVDTLFDLFRCLNEQSISDADRRALQQETGRLRERLESGRSTGPRVLVSAPDLDSIMRDEVVPWSDWSVSKHLARALDDHLGRSRPASILEVGSGVSTMMFARQAALNGASVTTLEHDPGWFERTRDLLVRFGLQGCVDLRYAPIREASSEPTWYDARLEGPYDFIFVDGPPLRIGRRAVLPAIHDHLSSRWTLWLKDGNRAHERACVDEWAVDHTFERRLWNIDPRGVWVLTGGDPLAAVTHESMPMVSCLMPTFERPQFVAQAARYFLRQTYPNRELVVVDDGSEAVGEHLPNDPRIRYLRLTNRASTGAKRNLACEHARGEVLICWDDDDWYGPHRIESQVEPILQGAADVTGLGRSPLFCIPTSQFWRCSPQVHARMFYKQVVGGTMAFRRCDWEAGARFPDTSLAEDAALLKELLCRGKRLMSVPNRDVFVYVRHDANSWQFVEGEFLDRRGWQTLPVPTYIPVDDLAFYRKLRRSDPITVPG
jgi:glycosyltransferase involved in cell wall biosynthesis